MLTKENVLEFLKELSALSQKHGIRIGSRGCSNCPWLTEVSPTENKRGYATEIWTDPNAGLQADELKWQTLRDD